MSLPILLVFISIAGLLIGGIILGRWDYSVRGLIVAVPAIISSIVLFFMFKHQIANDEHLICFRSKNAPYFLFALLYLISMIVLIANYNRLLYFFVIAALYFTVFIQIFSQRINSKAIILEIMSLMANVIYGTTLEYPLFFRTTDVIGHINLSTVTFLSGHTIPIDLDASYAFFPLFHIYNAISSNILGLSARDTQFIVSCPSYVIVIFFLYMVFKIISNNDQVSLLACLCFSVTPIVLLEGIMMVTRTAAFVAFVILLYLIFASNEKASSTETDMKLVIFKSLIILFVINIILVHQVSTSQVIMLMVIFMICELILAELKYFSTHLILFITIFFVAYWFFSAWLFAGPLIASRIGLDHFDLGEKYQMLSDPSLSQMQVAIMFLEGQMDMSIFLFFALVGVGYMLYQQEHRYIRVIAMFSLLAMIFYVPNPLFTSQTYSRMFRIDRFWILVSPFMAFAMSFGIIMLSKFFQKYARSKYHLLIFFLFIMFILFSLRGPIMDITSKEGRLYFTDGELNGYDFVTKKIPYGSELFSDYFTARFFCMDYFSLTDELKLPYYSSNILMDLKWSPQVNQYIIFQDSRFEDGSVIFKSGKKNTHYISNNENKRNTQKFYNLNNKIYSSNYISIIASVL